MMRSLCNVMIERPLWDEMSKNDYRYMHFDDSITEGSDVKLAFDDNLKNTLCECAIKLHKICEGYIVLKARSIPYKTLMCDIVIK